MDENLRKTTYNFWEWVQAMGLVAVIVGLSWGAWCIHSSLGIITIGICVVALAKQGVDMHRPKKRTEDGAGDLQDGEDER